MESDSLHGPLRARARTRDPLLNHLDVELDALRRMARRTRSAVSRVTWRRAAQSRANGVSTVLWLLEKVVPGRKVDRVKVHGAWRLSVQLPTGVPTLVLTLETGTGARTLTELNTLPTVRVHRRDLIDAQLLERLESVRLVRVVPAEAA